MNRTTMTTRRSFLGAMGTLLYLAGTAARGEQAKRRAGAGMTPGNDGEMLVFNHEFTWKDEKPFFCWLPIAPGLTGPGLMRVKKGKDEPPFDPFDSGRSSYPENWLTPHDYWNGTWQMRYQFMDRPSERPGKIQIGIWSDMRDAWTSWKEMTSSKTSFQGKSGIFFGAADDSPARTWWRLKKDEPVDFARVRDFTRLGFIMWTEKNKVLHPAKHLGEKSGWNDRREDYYPCTLKATIVAVPAGKTFSGWKNYA